MSFAEQGNVVRLRDAWGFEGNLDRFVSRGLFALGSGLLLAPAAGWGNLLWIVGVVVALDLLRTDVGSRQGLPWTGRLGVVLMGLGMAWMGRPDPGFLALVLAGFGLAGLEAAWNSRSAIPGGIGLAAGAMVGWGFPVLWMGMVDPTEGGSGRLMLQGMLACSFGLRWELVAGWNREGRLPAVRDGSDTGRDWVLAARVFAVELGLLLAGGLWDQPASPLGLLVLGMWVVSSVAIPGVLRGFRFRLVTGVRLPLGRYHLRALPVALLLDRWVPGLDPWMVAAGATAVARGEMAWIHHRRLRSCDRPGEG